MDSTRPGLELPRSARNSSQPQRNTSGGFCTSAGPTYRSPADCFALQHRVGFSGTPPPPAFRARERVCRFYVVSPSHCFTAIVTRRDRCPTRNVTGGARSHRLHATRNCPPLCGNASDGNEAQRQNSVTSQMTHSVTELREAMRGVSPAHCQSARNPAPSDAIRQRVTSGKQAPAGLTLENARAPTVSFGRTIRPLLRKC